MSVKSVLLGAAAAMSVLASGAQAAVITFDAGTIPTLGSIGGQTGLEDGFAYKAASGKLFLNTWGNPAKDMEGDSINGGGVLDIRAQDGSLFTFQTLDYAAYASYGTGSQTLTVTGWRDGALMGTDLFTLANVADYMPSYSNWTMYGAENLWGVNIDTLQIALYGGTGTINGQMYQAVDNITFGVSAVPEPATWAMMITGFGLAGVMLRRRRTVVAA